MKYIKLFEQFDDPFGEEIHYNKIIDSQHSYIICRKGASMFSSKKYLAQSIINGHITFYKNYDTQITTNEYDIIDLNILSPDDLITIYDRNDEFGRSEFLQTSSAEYWKHIKYKNLPEEIKKKLR